MKQKLSRGGEVPLSRTTTIRDVYQKQFAGQATIAMLAEACIAAGVFKSSYDEAVIALAKRECKRVIGEEDARGLNYAAPVRKTEDGQPVWVQRQFWNLAEYRIHVGALRRHRDDVDGKIKKYRDEARERFGSRI